MLREFQHKKKLLGLLVQEDDDSEKSKHCVELYQTARYATFTGDHIAGTPTTIEGRQAELDSLYADLLLLNALSPEMARLFVGGNWKKTDYPSASEADLALFGAVFYAD